jgi:hypothetical protein
MACGVPMVADTISRKFPFIFAPPRTLAEKRYDAEASFYDAMADGADANGFFS